MNYSFFEPILDAIFVIEEDGRIVYANEAAALFCETSVKRLIKGENIRKVIFLEEENIFSLTFSQKDFQEFTPYRELGYSLKNGKSGKVQIAFYPFKSNELNQVMWSVYMRDVTLETLLVTKYKKEIGEKEDYIKRLQEAQVKLELYSKNLEVVVQERTRELRAANQLLTAVMESLGEGFLVFGADRKVLSVFTKSCLRILETNPSGRLIEDVLRLEGNDRDQMQMWCQAVFSQALPFDSLASLAPQIYSHSEGREITLNYFSIDESKNFPSQVVLVATDRTVERDTARALEREKEYAQMILKIFKSPQQFWRFFQSTKQTIQFIVDEGMKDDFDPQEVFRKLHTLEGEAAAFSIHDLREAARKIQDQLKSLKVQNSSKDRRSLLIEYRQYLEEMKKKHQLLMTEIEEIFSLLSFKKQKNVMDIQREDFICLLNQLKILKGDEALLNQFYDRYLCQSCQEIFFHYNEVIQDIAAKLQKKIKPVVFNNGDLRIVSNKYQPLFETFIHIFRNIIDHGIEAPEERKEMGKDEAGEIKLTFESYFSEGEKWLSIEFSDDGKGIDSKKVAQRLKEDKLKLNEMNLNKINWQDEEELIQIIFDSGFSTKEKVDEFSGRGIGLNAVKTEVQKLGGKIRVFSLPNQGTTIKILMPHFGTMDEILLLAG